MKRVLTLFFAVLLAFCAIPQAVHATEPVSLNVEADRATANPGDTINYTVSLGKVSNLGGLEFHIIVPEGLTIVKESIAIPEGLETIMDSEGDIIKPADYNQYKWAYSVVNGYTGDANLVILTFSCTVDDNAAFEKKSVSLDVKVCMDNTDDYNDFDTNVTPATVTIEKRKIPVTGITLDKTTLSMKDGETTTLTATVVPEDADNKTVTWSSDNTAVAKVTNGTVTAVKAGTAKITAATEDGNKTAVCTVTVTCSHDLKKTETKEATCVDTGNIEYYTCSKCGKKFSDAAGTKEVTNVTVPATGKHVEGEPRGAVEATEEKEGYTGDIYCKVCGEKLKTGSVIPKLPHTHAMTKTEAVAPTCVKDGNIEYYTCSKCGKKYADEAGTKEVTDVTVKATGHKTDGVWKSDESSHWQICTVCSAVVNKENHSFSWVVDKAATEDETGLGHEECACGAKRSENTVIPKLDHVHVDIQHHPAVAATCMKEGTREYWTCSSEKCVGKYYGDEACQIEITDIVIPINPDNHVKEGTWEMDAEGHVRTCVCGAKVDEGVHVYDNDADAFCNMCNYQRHYVVIEGANGVHKQHSAEGLTFRVDGDYNHFQSLEIDGVTVAEEHYDKKEGSTIITLKPGYLNTLAVGGHSVKVLYDDGKTATTGFSIQVENTSSDDSHDNDDSTDNSSDTAKVVPKEVASVAAPKTGDDSHMGLWIGLLLTVIAGIAITGAAVRKQKRR